MYSQSKSRRRDARSKPSRALRTDFLAGKIESGVFENIGEHIFYISDTQILIFKARRVKSFTPVAKAINEHPVAIAEP